MKSIFVQFLDSLYIDNEPNIKKTYPPPISVFPGMVPSHTNDPEILLVSRDDRQTSGRSIDGANFIQDKEFFGRLLDLAEGYMERVSACIVENHKSDLGRVFTSVGIMAGVAGDDGGLIDSDSLKQDFLLTSLIGIFRSYLEFDILKHIDRRNSLGFIFTTLVTIFEFNPFSLSTGQLLVKMRQKNLKCKIEVLQRKGEITPACCKNIEKECEGYWRMANEEIGLDAMKETKIINQRNKIRMLYDTGITDVFDNPQYLDNPIMKSYFFLRSQMLYICDHNQEDNEEKMKSTSQEKKLWVNIKTEICGIFDIILDMRQDYLLKNFLKWFDKNLAKVQDKFVNDAVCSSTVEEITTLFEESVEKFMPRVNNTGVIIVDLEQDDKSTNYWDFGDSRRRPEFGGQDEVPDFDNLYQTEKDCIKGIFFDALPTILTVFMQSTDIELTHKISKIMSRLFSQREEFIGNIKNLEVITNLED